MIACIGSIIDLKTPHPLVLGNLRDEPLDATLNRAEARSNVIDARYEVLVLTASLKRAVGYSPLVPLVGIPGLVAEVSR